MATLNAVDFANVDPLVVSGWGNAGTVNTRVITLADTQKVFTRSASGTAIFQHLTPITSPVIRVQWGLTAAQGNNQNQKGGSIINLSTRTGFCAIHNGGNPGTVEIREVTVGLMGATALVSVAATTNPQNDTFYADYDTSTGEWKVYQAPEGVAPVLKLTHSVTPMTGNLVGGMLIGGSTSNITTFTVQGVGGTVTSITDPILIGAPITVGTTGFTTVTSITAAGMSATGISFLGGTTTATWPGLADGLVCNVILPATEVIITISDGINTPATIIADINLPANHRATPLGGLISDSTYLASAYALQPGWVIYYDQTQLGGMVIYPDSSIKVTMIGTFVCWVHKIGNGNVIEQLTVDVSTLLVINVSSWTVQSTSPIYDGLYHHSVRP